MPSSTPDLRKVTILIKTFLRDAHLADALSGIWASMPEVHVLVIDDGEHTPAKESLYQRAIGTGHTVVQMPFDSGFGAKSNEAIKHIFRPYLLIGSDDFNFRPLEVRHGIEKLVAVLDGDPHLAIASGRVNGNPYEGWLHDYGDRVVEEWLSLDNPKKSNGVVYYHCDLTVNYSLIRAEILGRNKICWYDDVKIGGGEHGAFFVAVKRAGYKVAYVPGVNISEQQGKPTDLRYSSFRGRASRPEREAFKHMGIREYVCFGGSVEIVP